MRTTITVDSATAEEVYDLTLAFQRTSRDYVIPQQIGTEPTVRVAGVAFGWTSPALDPEHATALLQEFSEAQQGRADRDLAYLRGFLTEQSS